tara:strand:+ start:984 stop:1550 length:567 start_codon:yes stop_codon:yes gene_type:complete
MTNIFTFICGILLGSLIKHSDNYLNIIIGITASAVASIIWLSASYAIKNIHIIIGDSFYKHRLMDFQGILFSSYQHQENIAEKWADENRYLIYNPIDDCFMLMQESENNVGQFWKGKIEKFDKGGAIRGTWQSLKDSKKGQFSVFVYDDYIEGTLNGPKSNGNIDSGVWILTKNKATMDFRKKYIEDI